MTTMQKLLLTTSFLVLMTSVSFSQSDSKVSLYLQGQYNKTLYDRTIQNNPGGIGLGLQSYWNIGKFRPTIDFTTDIYPSGKKVQLINPDGSNPEAIRSMINLLTGASYQLTPTFYISCTTGPSWTGNDHMQLALKPSIGLYFSSSQRWTTKLSYLNVFDRDPTTKKDFGAIGISLGLRLL